jgi:hypothetical protein
VPGFSACSSAAAMAADLAKIERPAVKLPEAHSGAVQYCLLVSGPDATQSVMVTHDGARLHASYFAFTSKQNNSSWSRR